MSRPFWMKFASASAVVAATALAAPLAADETQESKSQEQAQEQAPPAEGASYWLGVTFRGVDPVLREQLQLPENEGLVVEQVLPGSPAAKAGLKPHDILLKVDGRAIEGPKTLLDAVQNSEGEPLKFALLRAGEQETLAVTPGERPERFARPSVRVPSPDVDRLREWVERLRQGNGPGGPLTLRNFGPGVLVKPGAPGFPPALGNFPPLAIPNIPNGYEISITRKQDQPARITVKHGNDTWKVSENDVDQLPEEVRPAVKRMLAGGGLQLFGGHLAPGDMSFFEKQFEQMNRRMEQLRKEMQGLRDGQRKLRPMPEDKKI